MIKGVPAAYFCDIESRDRSWEAGVNNTSGFECKANFCQRGSDLR